VLWMFSPTLNMSEFNVRYIRDATYIFNNLRVWMKIWRLSLVILENWPIFTRRAPMNSPNKVAESIVQPTLCIESPFKLWEEVSHILKNKYHIYSTIDLCLKFQQCLTSLLLSRSLRFPTSLQLRQWSYLYIDSLKAREK